jgi:tryptophanyl-tRNA synthetase
VTTPPPRILSGIQPTGELHLGNYFGAIVQHLALPAAYPGECLFFIADFHALTTVRDPAFLRQMVRDVATTYLALGLDTERALLFRQSDIPEVCELTWMLMCVTNTGLLERAHAYKDKVAHGLEASMGLFSYPVLMAADILVYDSSLVPVGKDQVQHVEMAQDMATHFNAQFGRQSGTAAAGDAPPIQFLRRPEWKLSSAPYVPGLDGKKMSKSYGNAIPIFATGKPLRKLVGRIVTDSTPLGQPLTVEGDNVLALLDLFLDAAGREEVRSWYRAASRDGQPFGYGHAKHYLADVMEQRFADAHRRRAELIADPSIVDRVLEDGARRARQLATPVLERCRVACGLR